MTTGRLFPRAVAVRRGEGGDNRGREVGGAGAGAKGGRLGWGVGYVRCTDGSKGSSDREISAERLIEIRVQEQRDAGKILGLKDVVFLGYPDGYLEPTLEVRKDITREIRRWKPDVLIPANPTRDLLSSSYIGHPKHFPAGEALLSHVFPSAPVHTTFSDLRHPVTRQTHRSRGGSAVDPSLTKEPLEGRGRVSTGSRGIPSSPACRPAIPITSCWRRWTKPA